MPDVGVRAWDACSAAGGPRRDARPPTPRGPHVRLPARSAPPALARAAACCLPCVLRAGLSAVPSALPHRRLRALSFQRVAAWPGILVAGPMARLPPASGMGQWDPVADQLLMLTMFHDNIAWFRADDEGRLFPRGGVAQLQSSYFVGEEPYIGPLPDRLVQIHVVARDDTCQPLLYLTAIRPGDWEHGYSVWVCRWLAGWGSI